MPVLQTYLQQQGIAAESGTPRGTAGQAPAVARPGADVAGQTQGVAGALEFAASETRQADLALQIDVLKAHQQKAQDVLDSKLQQHLFQQDMQSRWNEERQNPEYSTLTERTMSAGKNLMDEHLKRLKSPQAQALFRENAEQYITLVQQKTLTEQQGRRDNATQFMLMQTAQGYVKAYTQASNEAERLAAQNDLEKTLYQAVTTGLMTGAQASELLTKTEHSAYVASTQVAIQADPQGMLQHLKDIGAGGQGNPNYPVPPRDTLAQLTQQAGEVMRQRMAELNNTEHFTQTRITQIQGQIAGNRRAEILKIELQPENVPQLVEQQRQIMEEWNAGKLSKADFENLSTFANAQIEKAKSPPKRQDDARTEDHARMIIELSWTPEHFAGARGYILQNQNKFTPETFSALMRGLEERREGSQYFKRGTYQDGLDIIAPGAFAKGAILYPQLAQDDMKHAYRNAFEAYNNWYKTTLEKEGKERVDELYHEKATQIRKQLLDVPMTRTSQLPRVLLMPDAQTINPDMRDVTRKIDELGLPDDQKWQYLKMWREKKIDEYETQEPKTRVFKDDQLPKGGNKTTAAPTSSNGVGVRQEEKP